MKSELIAVTKRGCPACEHTKPNIKKAQKHVAIREIDADSRPDVVRDLGTQAFPDIVYRGADGTVRRMPWTGVPTEAKIVRWANDNAKSKNAPGPKMPTAPKTGPGAAATCATCGATGGVSPAVWGPPVWFVIHMLALMYPQKPTKHERTEMKQFLTGLQKVLPCEVCQRHFAQELRTMDPRAFDSRDALFAWTVAFHDAVSDRTHSAQPRHSLTYWRNYYKRAAAATTRLKNTNVNPPKKSARKHQ
jgi:hypothetical protein